MAIEKSWPVVAPQPFTADGTSLGVVTIGNTAGFKVKQQVVISASGLPDLTVYVKRVVSPTQLVVGPIPTKAGQSLLSYRTDISAYTVAGGAFIYAEEQDKAVLKVQDINEAVYDQEPTVALRTVGVDQYGNYWNATNPLPVVFSSSFPNVVKIADGGGSGAELKVNSDGSINVVTGATGSIQVVRLPWNEVTSVASGITTTIVTYTAPIGKTNIFLQRAMASGDNLARYDVVVNTTTLATKRTWYGGFNTDFDFKSDDGAGYKLNAGDVVTIKVLHTRPTVGTFDGTLQVIEIT